MSKDIITIINTEKNLVLTTLLGVLFLFGGVHSMQVLTKILLQETYPQPIWRGQNEKVILEESIIQDQWF